MQDKWYIIVNPRAGSGKTMSEWMPAERLLDRLQIPYTESLTERQYHAISMASEAARNGYRKFLAVGGDGTLHEMYTGIMQYCDESGIDPGEFYIGVAPIGSGNDWIRMYDIPNNCEDVVRLMKEGQFAQMDVIKMMHGKGKTSYMANIGGIGVDSNVCERVNWQKAKGKRDNLIYFSAAQYTVRHFSSLNLEVIADGETVYKGSTFSIALGNGKYSGGGMKQTPFAEVNDGLLDITIVPKLSFKEIITELPRLLRGTVGESKYLSFFKCRELKVVPLNAESRDIFEVDGEIEGRLPLEIVVTGQHINVLHG